MMIRITILLLLNIFLAAGNIAAQYNLPSNRNWIFGYHTGISFNNNNITVLQSSMANGEGCSAVSDDQGNLLFYSDGHRVWSANGNLMPNGDTLIIPYITSFTTTQNSLVMPVPGTTGKYYLFVLGTRLYVYKIDMALNGGNGDIDMSFPLTNIPLADSLTEKMIAIPGCANNIWLVVKHNVNGQFLSYHIDANGITTTPVISFAGNNTPASYFQSTLCAGPDGQLIAVNSFGALELMRFDVTNGKVSDKLVVDSISAYGACFSPSGRYLYTNNGTIHQYDLWQCNPRATRVTLGSSFLGDIKLAPNDKIYFRSPVTGGAGIIDPYLYLGSIDLPDLGGTDCDYRDSVTETAMPLINPGLSSTFSLGLHNTVVDAKSGAVPDRRYLDTCVCVIDREEGMTLTAADGFSQYQWSNGVAGMNTLIQDAGTYWVSYQTSCGIRTDTFHVNVAMDAVTLTYNAPDLVTSGSYDSYQWFLDDEQIPNATGAGYTPVEDGLYTVVVSSMDGCSDTASLYVTLHPSVVAEIDTRGISVYPNPCRDMVTIHSEEKLQMKLTNVYGSILWSGKAPAVDMSRYPAGIYLLHFFDAGNTEIGIRKIVKLP